MSINAMMGSVNLLVSVSGVCSEAPAGFKALEKRRLKGAKLLARGISKLEAARQLGVTRPTLITAFRKQAELALRCHLLIRGSIVLAVAAMIEKMMIACGFSLDTITTGGIRPGMTK